MVRAEVGKTVIQTGYATVALYRPSDRSWWTAYVDPTVLGDPVREAAAIAMDWSQRHVAVTPDDVRPPTVVLHDPRQLFAMGCSSNSHFDEFDLAHTNRHADCAHGRTAEFIEKVARLY